MKRYIKSAVILLAALSLAGCSKTDEFQYNPDSALQIESVSGISPFSLMQEPASKAVISGETLPGDEAAKGIGLFVTATGGGAYDGKTSGYSNVKYAYSSAKWSAASPIYLSNTTGKLYGYFPYNVDATDLTAIPVESSLNGTDYLYATTQDVSFSNKSVNLQMNHALTRLHLTIKKGDKYLSDCNLSKIVLQSKAIDANGTMNITTGAVTAAKGADETGTVTLTGTDEVTATGIEKDILLVPASTAEGKKDITLILTIDGVEAKVNFTGDSGLDLRSGIQCNATLTIEDTGIKVTGVGVGVWGDGGSQTVEVSGHTVTVKLSDDAADAGIADDLIVQVSSNGSSVIVKTYSDSGKKLVIRNDDASLVAPEEEGNKSMFIFSEITKNITATLAYAKTRTVTFNMKVDKAPNVSGYVYGKAEPITVIEGRPSILTAIPGEGYAFDYFNVKGTKYSDKAEVFIPNDVETIDAYFSFTDWLSGVFSVGENTKVRFSRGNLWCDGTGDYWSDANPKIKSWGFESKQYESTPLSDVARTISHISHFMWCKSASESVKLRYAEQGATGSDNLFTNASPTEPNENFAVNGQKGFWRALSGGTDGEWEYLISRKDKTGKDLYKCGVTVCGRSNCLVLLPDDWEWDANTVGAEWQTEYSESTTVKWSTMEASGAVCLPAAGSRDGNHGDADVFHVGLVGYYWSASPSGDDSAFDSHFFSGNVYPSANLYRYQAYSVRLVTESK